MKFKNINEIPQLKHIEGYGVYSNGDVVSFKKKHGHGYIILDTPTRKLKPMITGQGYSKVELSGKGYFIHRLVAMAFIKNPLNKEEVNHIDANKLNNNVENLEWATRQENHNHKMKNNLNISISGEKHYSKKFAKGEHHCCVKVLMLDANDNILNEFNSIVEASEFIGRHQSGVVRCAVGKIKTCGGFKWKYK